MEMKIRLKLVDLPLLRLFDVLFVELIYINLIHVSFIYNINEENV